MTAKRWLIVRPEGNVILRTDECNLRKLQQAVDGYIQAVRLPRGLGYMYVNEDGYQMGLRVNPIATKLSRNIVFIVGSAVFLGPPDRRGDETDVPPKTEALLRRMALSWYEEDRKWE